MLLLALGVQGVERKKLNFNADWHLAIGDFTEAVNPDFDDSKWKQVTLPYAFNGDEAFKKDIVDLTDTVVWYRKNFNVQSSMFNDQKVFIEFEGVRQGADFYLNGHHLGMSENGVMACGFDLTPYIKEGDNVLAVRCDNSWTYRSRKHNSRYQWNDRNFNANYGGIPKNVFLHITDKLYQTLPLYSDLGTTGTYVYATDFNIKGRKATIHVESEVKNEDTRERKFFLTVVVKDAEGNKVAGFNGNETYTLQPGETLTVTINFQSAPGKDTYIPYEILVRTTLGDRIVMGMVLNTSLDSGFVIVGAPVLEFNDPGDSPQQACMQNRFFGSQIPVKVLSVTENGTDYLSFEPHGTLPYTVEPADYFYLDVYVNAMVKGYEVTTFTVQTDQNDCTYSVAINADILTVTELSAEAKLYPNPTTGLFTVEGANVARVEVYNLVGQKVHEAEGKTVSIDATNWNKGIYLVNIIEEKGAVVTKKLVVK